MAHLPFLYSNGLLLTLEGGRCKQEAVHQAAEAPHIDAKAVGPA